MEIGSLDGGKDVEHNGIGYVENLKYLRHWTIFLTEIFDRVCIAQIQPIGQTVLQTI